MKYYVLCVGSMPNTLTICCTSNVYLKYLKQWASNNPSYIVCYSILLDNNIYQCIERHTNSIIQDYTSCYSLSSTPNNEDDDDVVDGLI